jgi:hypothetical protein
MFPKYAQQAVIQRIAVSCDGDNFVEVVLQIGKQGLGVDAVPASG